MHHERVVVVVVVRDVGVLVGEPWKKQHGTHKSHPNAHTWTTHVASLQRRVNSKGTLTNVEGHWETASNVCMCKSNVSVYVCSMSVSCYKAFSPYPVYSKPVVLSLCSCSKALGLGRENFRVRGRRESEICT